MPQATSVFYQNKIVLFEDAAGNFAPNPLFPQNRLNGLVATNVFIDSPNRLKSLKTRLKI